VRGKIPTDEVMVAAKHQSFLDVILIYGAVPRGKFIMKRLLKWAPVLGWFALRIGCVPVDRGKRGLAIRKMLADVKAGLTKPGQLIIYPQGTRVAPGAVMPYKKGSIALYTQLNKPCFPLRRMRAFSGPGVVSIASRASPWSSFYPRSRLVCPSWNSMASSNVRSKQDRHGLRQKQDSR